VSANTFRDSAGRQWRLSFTVGDLPRLRAAGFDLGELLKTDAGFAEFLFTDPERLGRVLWTLVEAQAAAVAVSPEQFAAAMDNDALDAACEALIGYVVDFRHRLPGTRAAMKAAIPAAVRKVDEATLKAIESRPGGNSNPTAGGSPGSAGSTPAP